MRGAWAAALAVILAAGGAHAADSPGREMSTDRPDTTESPYTVEPSRLQLETTLFGYSRSSDSAEVYEAGTTNLRIGLTSRLEADVIFQPYGREAPQTGSIMEGVGDLTLRLKLNLAKPDGAKEPGDVAFALLPYVIIPTDRGNGISEEAWGGGLLAPVDIALGGPLSLGLNAGFVVKREDPARGHELHPLLTASLGVEWNDRWSTYYEVATELNRGDPAGDIVTLDTGFTYRPRPNLQFDAGVNLGATRGADRVLTFIGVSARF